MILPESIFISETANFVPNKLSLPDRGCSKKVTIPAQIMENSPLLEPVLSICGHI